jgi:iron complex transport system ATP-binding protein
MKILNLIKKYGEKEVVNNVTLEVPKGKITSFIGPNGAGKSTLLSMLSRLIQSNHGEIWIGNKEISQWKDNDLARHLSILRQSNHLDIRLTVEELVSFGRFPHSFGKLNDLDRMKIKQAMQYMKLTEMKNSFVNELSGGQRQRAFIAMTLAQDTEHILLDEPLNNLDMKHGVEIMKILRKLADEMGKTILLVIHDINFASCYSDHLVAMVNGKVVASGSPNEIIKQEVLQGIYDLDFNIREVNNKKICVYY